MHSFHKDRESEMNKSAAPLVFSPSIIANNNFCAFLYMKKLTFLLPITSIFSSKYSTILCGVKSFQQTLIKQTYFMSALNNLNFNYKNFPARSSTFIYAATSSDLHEMHMYEIGKLDSRFNNLHITNSSWWDTICVMVAFAVVLSVLLITISFFLAVKKPDAEKLSPYECGFEPFGHSRQKFDIRYYLVSLLFILFDLEVVYLFPLIAVDEYVIKNGGFIIAIIFLAILAIGIIYEFSKKALESV